MKATDPNFWKRRIPLWIFLYGVIGLFSSFLFYIPGEISYPEALLSSLFGAFLIGVPATVAGYSYLFRIDRPDRTRHLLTGMLLAGSTALVTQPLVILVGLPYLFGGAPGGDPNFYFVRAFLPTSIIVIAVIVLTSVIEMAFFNLAHRYQSSGESRTAATVQADDGPRIVNGSTAGDSAPGIPLRVGDRHVFVPAEEIVALSARGQRTEIKTLRGETLRARGNLKSFLARLPAERFMRVHRSHAAQLAFVEGMRYYAAGAYTLYLKDGANGRLPVGRKFAPLLRRRLGLGKDPALPGDEQHGNPGGDRGPRGGPRKKDRDA